MPVIGYEVASAVAKEALESGRGVYDIVLDRGLLTRAELDKILNPEAMTAPRTSLPHGKSMPVAKREGKLR